MTNILAVLILSSTFSVAVETNEGYVEKSFQNTVQGAEEFWIFAEPLIVAAGKKVKICTVSVAEDPGPIMAWLLDEDFGPALLSRARFEEYAAKNQSSQQSAVTAAQACLAAFPFIRRAT